MSNKSKTISSRQTVLTSTVADGVDFLLTAVAAVLSGNAVMLAKLMQVSADLVSDAFLYWGVRRSKQPSDRQHPFGYGREVYIWTALAALVMLLFTASAALFVAWQRLLYPSDIDQLVLSLLALSVSLVVNFYALTVSSARVFAGDWRQLKRRFLYSARTEGKMALVGDGLGFLSALFGIVALGLYWMLDQTVFDAVGALVIAVLLVISAVIVMLGVREQLIGSTVSAEDLELIRQAAIESPEVASVLDVKAVSIGPDSVLVSLEVHLQDGLTTDQIEAVIDRIEDLIRRQIPQARYIQIEPETP